MRNRMRRPWEGTASLAFSWVMDAARYFYYVPAYRPADDNRNTFPKSFTRRKLEDECK